MALKKQFFLVTCLGLVFMNFLTFAYHLTGSNLFNVISNAVSLLLITYSLYLVLIAGEGSSFYKVLLVLTCVFVGASYLANIGKFRNSGRSEVRIPIFLFCSRPNRSRALSCR